MVEQYDSFPTDQSENSDSDEISQNLFASNCKICKVKLNIIGLYHTKSIICSKCASIICMNCLSRHNILHSSKKKLCKICSDKEILLSDEGEIDIIQEEAKTLRINISISKLTTLQLEEENQKLNEKINALKLEILKKDYYEEISKLETEKIILEEDLNGIQQLIIDIDSETSIKRQEFLELQQKHQSSAHEVQTKLEEFCNLKKIFNEVERFKEVEKVKKNQKAYNFCEKTGDLRIKLLIVMEKNCLASAFITKLEHELTILKKLVQKAENLVDRHKKGLVGMSFIDKFNKIKGNESLTRNRCTCIII